MLNFYVDILRRHTPEIKQMLGNRWWFQQDNDPKHTNRLAKAFLRENMPEVMDCLPSNSPDLNPIENLWSIIKGNVERCMPKNQDELERFMIEEWRNIPESTLINLVGSMRQCCELVIEKKMVNEYHTKNILVKSVGFQLPIIKISCDFVHCDE